MKQKKYIDLNKILSRGAYLNIITSPRGPGKSWALKDRVINRFLKYGEKFVYVRRTLEEIDRTKHSHFDDILHQKHKGKYEIKVEGDTFFFRETPEDKKQKVEWLEFGKAIPVSRQQAYKSSAYPEYTTIYYDEFIPDYGWARQNPTEVENFMDLINTVFRDKKGPRRVFMLSNTGFVANPYFQHYAIKSEDFIDREFLSRNGGAVCIWYYRYDEESLEVVNESITSLIAGKDYTAKAVEGIFGDISTSMTEPDRPNGATPIFCMASNNGKFFRIFRSEEGYWIDEGKKISGVKSFTFNKWELYPSSEYDFSMIKKLENMINRRRITFSSPDVKATFVGKLRKS